MKFLDKLEKSKDFWFLITTFLLFFLLRLPSLFEPYWYGDEGIYQVIGLALRHGRLLYTQIWDNKPPLLYLLYAVFNSDQFTIRVVSLVFGLLSVLVFFKLAEKLFEKAVHKQTVVFTTTSLFAFLFAIPLIEGNIANSENFMLPLILLSAYYVISYTTEHKQKLLWFAGVVLSLAFLFKVVALFDLAAFGLFLFIVKYKGKKHIFSELLILFPLLAGFFIPIVLVVLYFVQNHAFWDFIHATLSQNVSYVAYGNNLIFTKGFLLIKLALLAYLCFFLFTRRKHLSHSILFVFLWIFFSTFNAFFSQRPYTHYVLVLLPSFVLLMGLLLPHAIAKHEGLNALKIKRATLLLFVVLLLLIIKNFNFYGKTVWYYQNFIAFAMGAKSVPAYLTFFDKNALRDYELASFIKSHSNSHDTLFIWGNNAQVYKLVDKLPIGRFTVAYHMMANQKTLKETQNDLLRVKPKFIVIVANVSQPFPIKTTLYKQRIIIRDALVYERIF